MSTNLFGTSRQISNWSLLLIVRHEMITMQWDMSPESVYASTCNKIQFKHNWRLSFHLSGSTDKVNRFHDSQKCDQLEASLLIVAICKILILVNNANFVSISNATTPLTLVYAYMLWLFINVHTLMSNDVQGCPWWCRVNQTRRQRKS